MRFFMFKQYSTAQKIINSVINKIYAWKKEAGDTSAVSLQHFAKQHFNYDHGDEDIRLIIELKDKRKLAEKLGDILKQHLPNDLYANYQKSSSEQKARLREMIANDYFNAIDNDNMRENTKHYLDPVDPYVAGTNIYFVITLEDKFFDPKLLAKTIERSVIAFKHELQGVKSEEAFTAKPFSPWHF